MDGGRCRSFGEGGRWALQRCPPPWPPTRGTAPTTTFCLPNIILRHFFSRSYCTTSYLRVSFRQTGVIHRQGDGSTERFPVRRPSIPPSLSTRLLPRTTIVRRVHQPVRSQIVSVLLLFMQGAFQRKVFSPRLGHGRAISGLHPATPLARNSGIVMFSCRLASTRLAGVLETAT